MFPMKYEEHQLDLTGLISSDLLVGLDAIDDRSINRSFGDRSNAFRNEQS